MRISTSMLYDLGVGTVQQQYTDLLKLQQQMGTGRRMLTPSDDPIAAARALDVSQSQSTNAQFMTNADNATNALALQESTLTQTGDLLQNARVLAVNAGNPALSDSDRASLATELQGYYDQLLGLANSTDGNGQYLFSGFKGNTTPFSESSPGNVTYNGDQGQRLVQISASRQVAVSSSGAEVFQRIRNGNGTFVTAAASANTGSGIVSVGTVLNPATWDASSRNFQINFTSATTYDVIDNGPPVSTVVTGAAYTSGSSITIAGVELNITGTPANGDVFTVKASRTDQDVFKTLSGLITALKTPVNSNAGRARLTNDLNTALSNIDLAQDNLLTVRSTVGAALKEVETQRNTGEDLALQYKSTLSSLQDLDYAKAISDMALKQANLDAAQKSFLKVQGLSLFNFINP